ncbi:MAG: hypothetical protein JNL48_11745 [Acidobacteria bacterium]|nr:hypothetical protein [Acidobacteriota bacterium]
MSRRDALFLCLAIATLLVLARTVPFMAPGVRFDADQAVVGLMAKHISEGRAFPVFFYGQSYLLAVEAYLAAPVMWLVGPTEVALKLPLLAMNVATVLLLVWRAHRDLGLAPWLALAGALPIALPAFTPGSRLMDAMGGNVEPLLYTLVLWTLRARPWAFGLTLGVFVAHREFTILAAAAIGALDLWHRRGALLPLVRHWAVAAACLVAAQLSVGALSSHGDMYGPGSAPREAFVNLSARDAIAAQICLTPSTWPDRGRELFASHLPLMAGGLPGPMMDVTISSGMGHGNPGLAPWVLALILAGLVCGVMAAPRGPAAERRPGAIPGTALPGYLVTVGALSTLVYSFVACSQLTQATLRYDLLLLFLPSGAVLAGLCWPVPAARAGLVTATMMWAGLNLSDYLALAHEIRTGRWPDHRGEAVRALEAQGYDTLWGDARLAYVLSFRSQERLTVAALTAHRVDEYARLAAVRDVPFVKQGVCAGGTEFVPDIWLCPTPAPAERPPVY